MASMRVSYSDENTTSNVYTVIVALLLGITAVQGIRAISMLRSMCNRISLSGR